MIDLQTTNIFIARHGETEYNRIGRIQGRGIDEPLNETGQQQAKGIAKSLSNVNLHHIFSSSLKRSIQTAEIIAAQLQLSVVSHPELDEMNFGVIEGQPIGEIQDELNRLHHSWKNGDTAFALNEAESPDDVLERVVLRTDQLLKQHQAQNILFVLHGRLIRILLAHWLDYGLSKMHHIEHQNGALYHLRLNGEEKMEPVFLSRTEHLEVGN